MIKDLVTVTCTRDINQMLLQAHSINKFVKVPVTHWVFIEDLETSEAEWEALLSPFYTDHTLKIMYDKIETVNSLGWIRQQICKFQAVDHVNADYIILDSKNFFIKDSTLDWPFEEGCGLYINKTNEFNAFIEFIHMYTRHRIPTWIHAQHTPFKVKADVLRYLFDNIEIDTLSRLAIAIDIFPSEFILYTVASGKELADSNFWGAGWSKFEGNTIYWTWWWNDELVIEDLEKIYNSKVEVLGLHKNVWAVQNDKLQKLSDWLIQKGLDPEVVQNATVKMDWKEVYLRSQITDPLTNIG